MGTFRDDMVRVGRKLVEAVSERTDVELAPRGSMEVLEAAEGETRSARKMSEWLRFQLSTMQGTGIGGRMPTDMTPVARVASAIQAQRAWMEDPMAGQQVDLYVSFVLGRGVPRPAARDPEVQDVLDACWDDPANKRILTSFEKLVEKAVDLAIQSNVFFTFFDEGSDGMVRSSLLTFEDVQDVVRHPKDKYRILQYRAVERPVSYDYVNARYVTPTGAKGAPKPVFYEAWGAFDEDNPVMVAQDEQARAEGLPLEPPANMKRPGRVVHLAVNKTSEMAFGVPRMRRLTRWFSAYNEVLESHVNRMKAMASIYMQAKVAGTQRDIDRMGEAAVGRRSAFGASQEVQPGASPQAPMGPGILAANQGVNFEPFKIDSGASDVAASVPQLRAQASGIFPPTYYGENAGSLAGQQSVELPVLKFIEREQEAWAGVFRALGEAAVDAAVKVGDLSEWRDPTAAELEAITAAQDTGEPLTIEVDPSTGKVKRELGFEVSLPSPLKRAMGDLVAAAVQTAAAVDPAGSNPELSRWLFGFILAQAFDVEDPQRIVDQVLPRHLAAQAAAGEVEIDPVTGEPVEPQRAPAPAGTETVTGQDGRQHPPGNPEGARQKAPDPEDRKVREAAARRSVADAFDEDVVSVARQHLATLAGDA